MLREVASLRLLARIVLLVSVGGLVPPALPHVASAASIDRTRLAAAGSSRVDHLPALSRVHVRDGGRLDTSRKPSQASAALAVSTAAAVVVAALAAVPGTYAVSPSSAERSSHRLRGPPNRL